MDEESVSGNETPNVTPDMLSAEEGRGLESAERFSVSSSAALPAPVNEDDGASALNNDDDGASALNFYLQTVARGDLRALDAQSDGDLDSSPSSTSPTRRAAVPAQSALSGGLIIHTFSSLSFRFSFAVFGVFFL